MNTTLNLTLIPKILFFWYITIFISTELLSFFHLINRPLIILINSTFVAANLYFFRQKILNLLREMLIKKSIFFNIATLILFSTFVQGFLSAPNTTDGMVRRLPIVMYWVQEHTLYQDVIRNGHDFMGPFSEYIFLHLYLFFNGDRMLFLSQWTAFTGVIIMSFIIAHKLGASSKTALLVSVLIATMPIAVLEATSVQTDMVTTVLVLFAIYYALIFIRNSSFSNCFLLSVAFGLGILSKATFLLYIVIPLGIILLFHKRYSQKFILFGLISLLIISLIQARFINQNLRLYGDVSGAKLSQGKSGYTNELISPQVTLSNVIRNLIIQLPFPVVGEIIKNWVAFLHQKLGLTMDDPRTNFYDTKFSVYPVIYPQEDIAGNPIHVVLIFIAGVLLIFNYKGLKSKKMVVYFYLLGVISFIIFSTILKWQPFHSRLLIPFFIVGSISSVIIVSESTMSRKFLNLSLLFSISLSFVLIMFNVSKPFISYTQFYPLIKNFAPALTTIPESILIKDREEQLFHARYYWYRPYKEIIELAEKKNLKGFVTFKLMDEFEYPMWYFLRKSKLSLRVIPAIKANNNTVIISTSTTPLHKEGYSTECIKTEVEYGYACISTPI